MWSELLMLVNDVRHISHGELHKRAYQAAHKCLNGFKAVLKEEVNREATDEELRESVDWMFKDLMFRVTHAS